MPKPKDVDGILASVRRMLMVEDVDRIVIDRNKSFIVYERVAQTDEEPKELSRLLSETVRLRPMEEYKGDLAQHPLKQFHEMCCILEDESLVACYILAGSREKLSAWLGIRFSRTRQANLLSVPITFSGDIPEDVLIVCGAPVKEVHPSDIVLSVKGSIP